MDPLSIAASIAGLISLTIQVSESVTSYGKAVKDAPKSIEEMISELYSMLSVLRQLESLFRSQQVKCSSFDHSSVLALAIIRCDENIGKLLSKLRQMESHKLSRAFERLQWPFSEKNLNKILVTIRRYTATFQFALTVEG